MLLPRLKARPAAGSLSVIVYVTEVEVEEITSRVVLVLTTEAALVPEKLRFPSLLIGGPHRFNDAVLPVPVT